jgi:hypothetical protein
MHWATYWRLQQRVTSLERRGVEALEASVNKMTARSRTMLERLQIAQAGEAPVGGTRASGNVGEVVRGEAALGFQEPASIRLTKAEPGRPRDLTRWAPTLPVDQRWDKEKGPQGWHPGGPSPRARDAQSACGSQTVSML